MSQSSKRIAPVVGALALALAGFAAPHVLAQDAAAPAEEAAPPADAAPAEAAPAEAAPAQAPEAAAEVPPETVVATIGDATITEADLTFAAEDLAQEIAQMPPEERRPFLLRVLIDMKLMAEAAREQGLNEEPLFQQRLSYLEDQALRREYFTDVIAAEVTPEAVQALYEDFTADFQPEDEIRASHILVETQEEAQALVAELEGGADFAALATEHSIDPGAANGGDLGFFSQGMMVQPFEEAAFALAEPGDISEPVQTQFGWHIIRLEERRQSQPPTMEQLAPQLQQQVLVNAFDTAVDELMQGITVDITDPELAAAVEAQQAAEDAATAPDAGAAAPAPAEGEAPAAEGEAAPAEGEAPAEGAEEAPAQ
jgi:peptidyl-prolyl cis-trans isomerase C